MVLAAAAGGFSDEQTVRPAGWAEVKGHRVSKEMFIARVLGKSMEPLIPDCSWCIFKHERGGVRFRKPQRATRVIGLRRGKKIYVG